MSDKCPFHDHLYEMPIEKLGLSVVAINALKRTGMTTIGDCIDYFLRASILQSEPLQCHLSTR
jgi:DNA-directed RNA polymerase alpha subunit